MGDRKAAITQTSSFVDMPDGVRLAVDFWLPENLPVGTCLPAIFLSTRYWRAFGLVVDRPEMQGFYSIARFFNRHGCALVVADARGSGASFGTRTGEWSVEEIDDMAYLIDWIEVQTWCNGRVCTFGNSYCGNTAFLAASTGRNALKVIAPQFADFDLYSQIAFPGGIPNAWLHDNWGAMTAAMDRNDFAAMLEYERVDNPEEALKIINGVRPVDDDDGTLLGMAIADHVQNLNLANATANSIYRDDPMGRSGDSVSTAESSSIYSHRLSIETAAVPIFYRAGWFDAGTAEGALNLFTTFTNPMRVKIGPWNHGMANYQDPFQTESPPAPIDEEENLSDVLALIEPFLQAGREEDKVELGVLDYFTVGENRWKETRTWPLPQTQWQSLFFAADSRLSSEPPSETTGSDKHEVDPEISTGTQNRWHTQIGRGPVIYTDRAGQDKALLSYTSVPLAHDTEITGHPRVRLFVRSDASDGLFLVYLEMVAPDGRVTLFSEGYLRALHRKIPEEKPPYTIFGPYHSFRREDGKPLVPGKVERLEFSLLPISILIPEGYSLRVSIAGADRDTFDPIEGCEAPLIEMERNRQFQSGIELPLIPGNT